MLILDLCKVATVIVFGGVLLAIPLGILLPNYLKDYAVLFGCGSMVIGTYIVWGIGYICGAKWARDKGSQ